MSFKSSTGTRDALLAALKVELDGGLIKIYDDGAAEPSSANDAVPGGSTLLVTISNNSTGTGITFAAPSSGIMQKTASETWSGVNASSGTAAWYRFIAIGDTGALSTTECRVQGSVGILNADLLLASTSLTATEEQRVDYYAIGMPSA
ncbi:MAG: hypothetical protein WC279_11840 [Sulfurimonas sp.]|jgi:hypothetical protein|uniref:hypothetical protein n=1 Tax=Sulfurimonas sp. TaxID=2022749 RepID=UPI0029FBC4DF|nr:hypothetical protein [Syntrophales bacterium]